MSMGTDFSRAAAVQNGAAALLPALRLAFVVLVLGIVVEAVDGDRNVAGPALAAASALLVVSILVQGAGSLARSRRKNRGETATLLPSVIVGTRLTAEAGNLALCVFCFASANWPLVAAAYAVVSSIIVSDFKKLAVRRFALLSRAADPTLNVVWKLLWICFMLFSFSYFVAAPPPLYIGVVAVSYLAVRFIFGLIAISRDSVAQ